MIILFDIDSTLLVGGKSNWLHRLCFENMFDKIFGVAGVKLDDYETDGKTDRQIIYEILTDKGVSRELIDQKIPEGFRNMIDYFNSHIDEYIPELTPNTIEFLTILKAKGHMCLLLTGNIENIGWSKIEKAGIRPFFEDGAFGDETEKRADLVAVAHQKAEAILNRQVALSELVVIGDTPRDVSCAQSGGVRCVGVATGRYTQSELSEVGADLTIADFKEDNQVLDWLEKSSNI